MLNENKDMRKRFGEVIMKHTLAILTLLLCGTMLFSACTPEEDPDATTTHSSTQPTPVDTSVSITYTPSEGADKSKTGEGSAELTVTRSFAKGDNITVRLPEGQHYLAFSLDKDSMEEAILYLPESVLSYDIPNISLSYPKTLTRTATITARIPTDDELAASRNLALNPADLMNAVNVYPHASATSVHDVNNEGNRLQFEARNAIDGFTQNNGHGGYPLQSWGPASNMDQDDSFFIEFGREVTLTELIVYLRADFPHDTYWDRCTALFSDGTEMTLDFTKSADAQSFKLDTPVTTDSVKFSGFQKVAGSDWAAWMEVEAIGSDIIG